ncbi:hypothetical protein F-VV10_0048 [Faustovirus]|nr:hypothetical protein F-VV10_0048 [Faustovirus]
MNNLFFYYYTKYLNMASINNLTDVQKGAICALYCRYVKTSWLNIFVQYHLGRLQIAQVDSRLRSAYGNVHGSEYGYHWVRFGAIRVLFLPKLADEVLESGTMIACGDSNANQIRDIAYHELTRMAATQQRYLLEYIVVETFKHTPGDELFGICDDLKIHLPYRYNINNPEPRTITLVPLRNPGKANERKVHKFVVADASERFRTTVYGSGQIKAKNTIEIDCDTRLLRWFIDGLYAGVLDLNLIRRRQRKYAYKMLDETLVCTSQELGDKMAIHFGLVDIAEDAPTQNYFDNDSDSDSDSD